MIILILNMILANPASASDLLVSPQESLTFQATDVVPLMTPAQVQAEAALLQPPPKFIPAPNYGHDEEEPSGESENQMQSFMSMLASAMGMPAGGNPQSAFRSVYGTSGYGASPSEVQSYGPQTYNDEYDYSQDMARYGLAGDNRTAKNFAGHNCDRRVKDRLTCMVCNIYFEAGGEPNGGQIWVGRSVMTRVFSKAYEPTVCENVYKVTTSKSGKKVAQYSWVLERKNHTLPGGDRLNRVVAAAKASLAMGPNGYSNYFAHNIVNPDWAREAGSCRSSLKRVNNHTFCKINASATRTVAAVAASEGIATSVLQRELAGTPAAN